MNLGTKVNLMLVAITAVILSVGFFVSSRIDSGGLERQISQDADGIIRFMRADIEPIVADIQNKQDRLQGLVSDWAKIKKVSQVSIIRISDNRYIASSNPSLVGKKISDSENSLVTQVVKGGKSIDVVGSKTPTSFELERRIPIFSRGNNEGFGATNILKIQVTTASKDPAEVKEAQDILRVVAISMEQAARPSLLSLQDDVDTISRTVAGIKEVGFFRGVIVYDAFFNRIGDSTVDSIPDYDSAEYVQYRQGVLSGDKESALYSFAGTSEEIFAHVVPISVMSGGKQKPVGIIEARVSTLEYRNKIDTLKLRLGIIAVLFSLITVATIAFFLKKKVTEPVQKYSLIAKKVADGDFNQTVEHTSNDEIGRFGDVFNSMLANLREFDRMKSGFLSVAAHQLRTPLSGIKWVFKLLLDEDLGQLSEDQRQMLKRGYETSEKMAELVNGLLNVSRIENGKFGYKFEKNDIQQVFRTLIESSQLASREHNINLRFDNRVPQLTSFVFDVDKLPMAFQNIVDNAIKYTLPGGSVTVTAEQQGDFLQVRVSDTGVGIPKAEIPKLFSKFFRAANVIHLQTEGSGLGLFIAKSIILRHGGEVSVASVEGKGTTFVLTIPLLETLIPKEYDAATMGNMESMQRIAGAVV